MQIILDTGAAINGKFAFNGPPGDLASVLQKGVTLESVLEVQKTINIRAPNATYNARANAAKALTFTVANLWATISQAEDEWLTYEDNLLGQSGTLIMTTVNDKGSVVRYLNNAVVKAVKSINMGVTNYHTITVYGSSMTAQPLASV